MVTGRRQGRRGVTGVLLILGLAAVAAFIVLLDDIRDMFAESFTIVGVFSDVNGLGAGSPVWIAGRPAGVVTRIEMLPSDRAGHGRFAATMRIAASHAKLLRRDSELTLATRGLLSKPALNLLPGSADSPPLAPGDTLIASRPLELRQFFARFDSVRGAIDSIDQDRRRIASLARARQPAMQAAAEALGDASAELRTLAVSLDDGSLGRLAGDTALLAALSRIRDSAGEIAARVEARMARVRDPALAAALDRLSARADTLRGHADALRAMLDADPRGFLARWRSDPALRDAFAEVFARVDSLVAEVGRAPWRWVF